MTDETPTEEQSAARCAFAATTVTLPPEGAVTFSMDVQGGTAEALRSQFSDLADPQELVED